MPTLVRVRAHMHSYAHVCAHTRQVKNHPGKSSWNIYRKSLKILPQNYPRIYPKILPVFSKNLVPKSPLTIPPMLHAFWSNISPLNVAMHCQNSCRKVRAKSIQFMPLIQQESMPELTHEMMQTLTRFESMVDGKSWERIMAIMG